MLASAVSVQLQQKLLHREFWIQLFLERILPLMIPLLAWLSIFAYAERESLAGWSEHEMTAYYILVFLIGLLTDIQFHYEMSQMVHLGTLNQWLIRPLSFLETATSYILARMIMLLIPGTVALLLCLAFMPAAFGALSFASFFHAALVLPLAVALFCLLSAVIGTIAFWVIHTEGVFSLTMLTLEFLGGRLLPLDLLPSWLEKISRFLPLRFGIAGPVKFILHPTTTPLFPILAGQALWCLLLSAMVALLWRAGLRRYDAVGG